MHIRVYERKMCCFFFILNHQVGTSVVIYTVYFGIKVTRRTSQACFLLCMHSWGTPPSDPVSSFAQAHRDCRVICKYI